MNIIPKIKQALSLNRVDFDEVIAYLNTLPDDIEVTWERDNDFIIGVIKEDGKTYMTQAKSGDEFIEMVNDAVYTACNIPENLKDSLGAFKAYEPPEDARKKLGDLSVHKAEISVRRKLRAI